ncbi:MAG: hypothetical protein Q7V53_06265, partial [Caldisericota bacterium]|nr:hypothetical protein [Caldisericota bacterium]
MVQRRKIVACSVACMLVLGLSFINTSAIQPVGNWGFERGTLDGWTVVSAPDYVGVSQADQFTAPYWGEWMAVLGLPRPVVAGQTPGMNTIRRLFTATMHELSLAYNVYCYDYPPFDNFSYVVKLYDEGTVIASWSTTSFGPSSNLEWTGWQLVTVDLSAYHDKQLTIEVSAGGTLDAALALWAYVDVYEAVEAEPAAPVTIDMMPSVRFVTPSISGTTVGGKTADIVIEASDDRALADVRLLVNGVLAGQTVLPGRQTFRVSLQNGANTLQAIATDSAGKQAMVATVINADAEGPVVTLDQPVPERSSSRELTLAGTVWDAGSGVRSMTLNDEPVMADVAGGFSTTVRLVQGANTIELIALDNLGNVTSQTLTVTYSARAIAPSSIYVLLTIGSRNMEVNGLTRTLD